MMKNIKKFLSFKSFIASKPSASLKVKFFCLSAKGGVFGRPKLKRPKIMEARATILNVLFNLPEAIASIESQPKI